MIDTTSVEYGTVPAHADASKENTDEYTYTFAGWSPDPKAVTGEETYTATYTALKNSYTVTWKNDDGSVIDTTSVEYGTVPTHADASKENTDEYTYTFAGWSPDPEAVTGDAEYTAEFTSKKNSYTVTWKNDDGSVIDTTSVEYGTVPTHADATKENTDEYTYTFAGWTPEPEAVTGDAEYTAEFTSKKNSYTVTWKNDDGSVIDTTTVEYGTVPSHADASKENTDEYTYTFAGWTPEIAAVTGEAEYTAAYTSQKNSYTITWKNDDGSVIDTTTVEYGTVPSHADATKENTAEYTYTFAGWTPEIAAVTGEAEYTAAYTSQKNSYTITWKNDDGSVIDTTTVEYGVIPTHTDAVKSNTDMFTYVFSGWTPNISAVTGDAEYTAVFANSLKSYTVTWLDEDGNVINTTAVEYGAVPTHADLTKENTAEYTYTFAGWSPELKGITGDSEYRAVFDRRINEYTVIFSDEDGTQLQSGKTAYGEMPAYGGMTPAKASDGKYSYEFSGWSPAITAVSGDAEYRAVYKWFADLDRINGEEIDWEKDSGEGIVLKLDPINDRDISPEDLESIEIDGEPLERDLYRMENGTDEGNVIIIGSSVLETLSEGSHALTVRFRSGQVSAAVRILKAEEDDRPSAPQTGDGNIGFIIFVSIACIAAVAAVCFSEKWRRALNRYGI